MKNLIINLASFIGLSMFAVSCMPAPDIVDNMPVSLSFDVTDITAKAATIVVNINIKDCEYSGGCSVIVSTSKDFDEEYKIFPDYRDVADVTVSGDVETYKIKAKDLNPTTKYYYRVYRFNSSGMEGFPGNIAKTFETKAMQNQILSWDKDYSTVRFGQELDLTVNSNLEKNVPVYYTFQGSMYKVNNSTYIPMDLGEIEITAHQEGTSSGYPAKITKTINVVAGSEQYTHNKHVGVYMGVDTRDGGKIYWSPYNVGSNYISSAGKYFSWGVTKEQTSYFESECPTSNLSYDQLLAQGYIDQDGVLIKNDVAHSNYGYDWRMPTVDEMRALMDKCTYRFIPRYGAILTSTVNGNSLFFPAGGYKKNFSHFRDDELGCYWTSSPNPNTTDTYAFEVENSKMHIGSCYRFCGFNVRPVFVVYPK